MHILFMLPQKPSNVLLVGEEMRAVLADVGLAKTGSTGVGAPSTAFSIKGTPGLIDPLVVRKARCMNIVLFREAFTETPCHISHTPFTDE